MRAAACNGNPSRKEEKKGNPTTSKVKCFLFSKQFEQTEACTIGLLL